MVKEHIFDGNDNWYREDKWPEKAKVAGLGERIHEFIYKVTSVYAHPTCYSVRAYIKSTGEVILDKKNLDSATSYLWQAASFTFEILREYNDICDAGMDLAGLQEEIYERTDRLN